MSWFSQNPVKTASFDNQNNNYINEVIGNKTDTAVYYTGTTTTLASYLKGLTVTNEYSTRCTARTTATLPQSTAGALFTISGRVIIERVVGEVTVEIGSGANLAKLTANPTVGADVDLCTTLDIDGDVVGTMYHINGDFGDPMVATTSGAIELVSGTHVSQPGSFLMAAGTLDLSCNASKTGSVKWTVHWRPFDSGATVTAA